MNQMMEMQGRLEASEARAVQAEAAAAAAASRGQQHQQQQAEDPIAVVRGILGLGDGAQQQQSQTDQTIHGGNRPIFPNMQRDAQLPVLGSPIIYGPMPQPRTMEAPPRRMRSPSRSRISSNASSTCLNHHPPWVPHGMTVGQATSSQIEPMTQ